MVDLFFKNLESKANTKTSFLQQDAVKKMAVKMDRGLTGFLIQDFTDCCSTEKMFQAPFKFLNHSDTAGTESHRFKMFQNPFNISHREKEKKSPANYFLLISKFPQIVVQKNVSFSF